MIVRKYDMEKDYHLVHQWMTQWEWNPIHPLMLSSNGWIAEKEAGVPLAFVFLYMTDSACCWMEWLVSNPDADRRDVMKAIPMVVDALKEFAKEKGFRVLFTTTVHPNLKKLYPRLGFEAIEDNVAHFGYVLKKGEE